MIVSGTVIRGLGLGRKIGFPTLNLHPRRMPRGAKFGIYAVRVTTPVGRFPGALHYGHRKTHNAPISLEVHCLGLKKKIYGKRVRIEFVKRIRTTKKFHTITELKRAIAEDIKKTREIVSSQESL